MIKTCEDLQVSLMLHTFLGTERGCRAYLEGPFSEHLRSAISLEEKATAAGSVITGGHRIDPHSISDDLMGNLLDITFDRYCDSAA